MLHLENFFEKSFALLLTTPTALNARKILLDFLKSRKYNYGKRVASKRKSSLHAARFYFAKKQILL